MKNKKTLMLCEFALLVAVEVVMSLTPLGFLHLGFLDASLLTIPVAVAAILRTAAVLLNEAASIRLTDETSASAERLAAVAATWSSLTNGIKQSILFILSLG